MPTTTPVPAPVLTSGPQPYPLMFGPDPGVFHCLSQIHSNVFDVFFSMFLC